MTQTIQTTAEDFEFRVSGGRVIIPTPDHEAGGGVALTSDVITQILAFPTRGRHEETQVEWEYTGDTNETRVGASKVVEIVQTSFGTTRTTTATLVDLGDSELELH